ncbi:NME NM23 member 5 [Borealophlyctis nickersoniae]|nr:NME NM23 member 5 [Borealophlyctis nickersoniae]
MDRVFVLIKPEASSHEDDIIYKLKQNGFKIINRRRTRLTPDQAADFYAKYSADEAFDELIEKMTSGPVVALAMLRYNGLEEVRNLLGNEDPAVAREKSPQSLRALYGKDELLNGLHASDSPESVARETQIFFPDTFVETPSPPESAKVFFERSLYPTLTQGLTQLCKEKPANPTAWLGNWLLENNPNKPKVTEPVG